MAPIQEESKNEEGYFKDLIDRMDKAKDEAKVTKR